MADQNNVQSAEEQAVESNELDPMKEYWLLNRGDEQSQEEPDDDSDIDEDFDEEPDATETGELGDEADDNTQQTFEVKGEQLTLEELQNGYLRQSDYTKKTQELADQRRTTEPFALINQHLQNDPQLFAQVIELMKGGGQPKQQEEQEPDDAVSAFKNDIIKELAPQFEQQQEHMRQMALAQQIQETKNAVSKDPLYEDVMKSIVEGVDYTRSRFGDEEADNLLARLNHDPQYYMGAYKKAREGIEKSGKKEPEKKQHAKKKAPMIQGEGDAPIPPKTKQKKQAKKISAMRKKAFNGNASDVANYLLESGAADWLA